MSQTERERRRARAHLWINFFSNRINCWIEKDENKNASFHRDCHNFFFSLENSSLSLSVAVVLFASLALSHTVYRSLSLSLSASLALSISFALALFVQWLTFFLRSIFFSLAHLSKLYLTAKVLTWCSVCFLFRLSFVSIQIKMNILIENLYTL